MWSSTGWPTKSPSDYTEVCCRGGRLPFFVHVVQYVYKLPTMRKNYIKKVSKTVDLREFQCYYVVEKGRELKKKKLHANAFRKD
jgi:hypothetical protein